MKKKILGIVLILASLTACSKTINKYAEEAEYNELKMEKQNIINYKDGDNKLSVEANTFVDKKENIKVIVKLNEKEIINFDKLVGSVKISELKGTYLIDFEAEMTQCETHYAYLVDKEGKVIADLSKDNEERPLRKVVYSKEEEKLLTTYTLCGDCPEGEHRYGYTHKYDYEGTYLSITEYVAINCPGE